MKNRKLQKRTFTPRVGGRVVLEDEVEKLEPKEEEHKVEKENVKEKRSHTRKD